MPVLAVQKAINSSFWIRTETGFQDYVGPLQSSYSIYTGAEYPYVAVNSSRAQFVSLGLGFRWQPPPRTPAGIATYVELMPVLFGFRWHDRLLYQRYDTTGVSIREESHELTRIVPGFVTGVGLRFRATDRWHVDYGVRYQRSGRVRHPDLQLLGLSHLALMAQLSWTR